MKGVASSKQVEPLTPPPDWNDRVARCNLAPPIGKFKGIALDIYQWELDPMATRALLNDDFTEAQIVLAYYRELRARGAMAMLSDGLRTELTGLVVRHHPELLKPVPYSTFTPAEA